MTITASQQAALNALPKFIPALAPNVTGFEALTLGDEIAALQAIPSEAALLATLKAGAADVGAAVSTPAAVTSSQNSTAAATDLTTAEALANALKTSYNAAQVDIVALRASVAALVVLVNDLRTQHNALADAIDGA